MQRCLVFVLCFAAPVAFADSVKLMLNWKPEAEFGGFYAAQIAGEFEKERLTVEIVAGGVGTPTVQMVAAGRAEFGIASADEVILSRDRGTDVVALYAVLQTNPQGFMVRADRGITKIEEAFHSGILAVQRGLPYFLFLEKKYGPFSAKIVPYLGGVAQIAEDAQVTQQCFVTSEPIIADKKGLKTKAFLVAETGFNPYGTVVIVKRAYAEKHAATISAFKRAIDAGWKAYLNSSKNTNEAMHKLNPSMDMETLERSARIQKPLVETETTKTLGLGSMSESRWAELAIQLKSLGLIKAVKAADNYYWK